MRTIVYPIKVCKSIFKNYCYLVVNQDTHDGILVDPAWEIDKIEQKIHDSHISLRGIFLTHHHFDHVNLADLLARKYNIPVYISKIESEYYQFSCYNLVTIDKLEIHDKVELQLAQIKIISLLTPGHTKGAVSYWIANSLFSGDTLFIEGCGICSGKGADPQAMFNSLSYLKSCLPSDTHIYPGHSFGEEPGKPFSYLLQNNIYLNFTKQDEFIAFRMRENQRGLMVFK